MKIYFRHTIAPNGGYGILGKGIKEAFRFAPFELIGYNDEIYSQESPDVVLTYGMPDLIDFVRKAKKTNNFFRTTRHWKRKNILWVHYAVWESSQIPPGFINAYKKPDLMLVSTKYIEKAMRKGGLKNALIWHHGIDPRFKFQERRDDGVFTFLHHNAYEFRKGWEVVLQAFTQEFYIDEPVKLIMKARERRQSVWILPQRGPLTHEQNELFKRDRQQFLAQFKIDHPLIEEKIGHLTDDEMVELNAQADCFVFPAKGEGWGLPPFEAAAMGITPIVTARGSFKEWFRPDCMIEAPIAGYFKAAPRYPGYMFYPSVLGLRRKMRWAFEHQTELREMGRKSSKYIHAEYNWSKIINELHSILQAKLK